MDIIETIKEQIAGNRILLYMKGSPNQPQCGFSARTVEALMACGERFAYVDILSNPEIRSLKSRVEATRLEVAKASAGHYPTLDLVAQISNGQSDSVTNPFAAYYNCSIGVQLSLPIYSGGYVTSTERQAAAQLQNAQAVLDGAVLDLSLRVEREYRNVTEGAAKIQALATAAYSAKS